MFVQKITEKLKKRFLNQHIEQILIKNTNRFVYGVLPQKKHEHLKRFALYSWLVFDVFTPLRRSLGVLRGNIATSFFIHEYIFSFCVVMKKQTFNVGSLLVISKSSVIASLLDHFITHCECKYFNLHYKHHF